MNKWRAGWSAILAGMLGLWPVAPACGTGAAGPADLVIWAWRDETARQLDGVTPMVWVEFNVGHRPKRQGTTYHTARPDHEIANDVLRTLDRLTAEDRLPPGHLGLFLWHAGTTADPRLPSAAPRGLFPESHRPEALQRGGFTEHTEDLVRRVMQRLNVEGVRPDFVILDYEEGAGRWHLGLRGGQLNPAAYTHDIEQAFHLADAEMPASLRELGPEAMQPGHPHYRRAVTEFNQWAGQRRNLALRSAIFEPTYQAFGTRLPSSNYNDTRRAWPGLDLNGWDLRPNDGPSSTAGTWSSPVNYLKDVAGQRYRKLPADEALARVWADQRNGVRAALAATPDVAPWYNNPDDGRPEGYDVQAWRWAWAAGLMHDRASGVRRMLWWSPNAGWSDEEIAFARPVIAALHALSPTDRSADPADPLPDLRPVPDDQARAWRDGWVHRAKTAVQFAAPDLAPDLAPNQSR